MISKNEWRREFKTRLARITSDAAAVKSRGGRIQMTLSRILKARPGLWLAFSATSHEPELPVQTDGVQFAYPRVVSESAMTFYSAKNPAALWNTGSFGIHEPDVGDSAWIEIALEANSIRGILVPGLGFDRRLRRLGRGAGFYDRFLENSRYLKVGVGFAEQLVDELPTELHDIGLDGLVTDQEVIWKVGPEGRLEGSRT